MKKATIASLFVVTLLPSLAHAQSQSGLFGLLDQANKLIGQLLPFVITLTLLVFLWGILKYVISGGDGTARKEAVGYIIWGLIALFVMVSVWGLVNILVRTFNPDNQPPLPPQPIGGLNQ